MSNVTISSNLLEALIEQHIAAHGHTNAIARAAQLSLEPSPAPAVQVPDGASISTDVEYMRVNGMFELSVCITFPPMTDADANAYGYSQRDALAKSLRAMLSAHAAPANGMVTRDEYVAFGKSRFLDGLQTAIVLCDELCWAIDAGGNQYRREAPAGRVLMRLREAYATASRTAPQGN